MLAFGVACVFIYFGVKKKNKRERERRVVGEGIL